MRIPVNVTGDVGKLLFEADVVGDFEGMWLKWGLSPCARQMRDTVALLMPACSAMVRVVQ